MSIKNRLVALCRMWLAVGVATAVLGWGSAAIAADIITLDQGWDKDLRSRYYYTPQGSWLMPYSWFLALERVTDTTPFASAANLKRYGWVGAVDPSPLNPDALPIGFVKDPTNQPRTGPWVGMSCASCHTNDITYRGRTIRIDGAPSMADFTLFISELSQAVNITVTDEARFNRFASKVLKTDTPTPTQVMELKSAFALYSAEFSGRAFMLSSLPAGPGRVDALTQIINSLGVTDLAEPDNLRSPSAPVSYPFLWLTPKLDWVQWNPVATNPIARNVGEVMGVFGHANLTGPQEQMFTSTARIKQLFMMEEWLATLKPPPWQEELLGQINRPLAAKGKKLFEQDCRACHNMPPFDMTAKEDNIIGKQFIKITGIQFRQVGTDPSYSLALLTRLTKTGDLSSVLFQGKQVVPSGTFFLDTVREVVERSMADANLSPEEKLAYSDYRFFPPKAGERPAPWRPKALDTLKAGPLLGIWATGPFLHNGSVPNIYELLSPPEQRSKVFWVGSSELDTEKLGFRSTEKDLSPVQRAALFIYDTRLPGNSNSGHIYPSRSYSHAERLAVIEFLKLATLPQ